MQIALISDSHGNAVGLKAALDDLANHPADQIVYLGDAIQGGTQPLQCVELLEELQCPIVLGNSDNFIVSGEAAENVPPASFEIKDWTRDQLGADGLKFIESFTPTVEVDLGEGRKLVGFHGSPKSFDDVILPETPDVEVEAMLVGDVSVFAGGHTHLQWTRKIGDSIFVNPGSAGAAYNRNLTMETFYFYPIAQYAILHASKGHIGIEFCQVPFDVDELEKGALASGRPYSDREGPNFRPKPPAA